MEMAEKDGELCVGSGVQSERVFGRGTMEIFEKQKCCTQARAALVREFFEIFENDLCANMFSPLCES